MNKAIMIADKPIWCAKIMNGDKTVEVRTSKALYKATKKLIEEQGYATFFMYCTKEDSLCRICKIDKDRYICGKDFDIKDFPKLHSGYEGKGKVVAKFTVKKVEEITIGRDSRGSLFGSCHYGYHTESLSPNDLMEQSCLDVKELINYLRTKTGYAYHIEDLVVFDKPKELSEFKRPNPSKNKHLDRYLPVKVPQNFCYVESEVEVDE